MDVVWRSKMIKKEIFIHLGQMISSFDGSFYCSMFYSACMDFES